MPRNLTDTQLLNRSIRKLKKLFEPNCHDNSRNLLLYKVESVIADVRANGDLIDASYCESISFPSPENSSNYTDIQALHLALTQLYFSGYY